MAIEKLYTVAEVAEYLQVSERTVFRFINGKSKKLLPAIKIGGRWRIKEADLAAFINKDTNEDKGEND